jgi:FkbM family methyltransferase
MSKAMKRLARRAARAVLGRAPAAWGASLARLSPRLAGCLPGGRTYLFAGYLGRLRVAVDPAYPIEREMLRNGYEPELARLLPGLVGPGACCVDVGANVGAVTLALAARAGPAGHVWAFEPGPPLFARLRRNVALNPDLASAITLVNRGVSDRAGVLLWNEDPANPGNAGLLDPVGTPVPVVTLDDYFACAAPPRLDFVKVDVEGMEYEVLAGGREVWRRYRPALYFETLPAFDARRGGGLFSRIERLLADLSYRLYRPEPGGGLTRASAGEWGPNTLALPAGR